MPDLTQSEVLEKVRSHSAPEELKRSLAKGIYPLGPAEMIEVLILLAAEESYRDDAVRSLRKMPRNVVLSVCGSDGTPSGLLSKLAKLFSRNEDFLERIVLNPSCSDATMVFVAGLPFPRLLEIVGRNYGRMMRESRIAEALTANTATPTNVLRLWEEDQERRRTRDDGKYEKKKLRDAEEEGEAEDLPTVLIEEVEGGGQGGEAGEVRTAAVEQKRETIQQLLRGMTAGQKVALASKGNGEVRKILIRDKNRLVCQKVLENPRISDSEVEQYAKSTNVSDDVLRFIGSKREWVKLRMVVRALVQNPKTPLGLSMHHLKGMTVKELEILSKNRNIPETLRKEALKLYKLRQEKRNR